MKMMRNRQSSTGQDEAAAQKVLKVWSQLVCHRAAEYSPITNSLSLCLGAYTVVCLCVCVCRVLQLLNDII